tara:strand:- start:464 stop:1537 length:1074 start_codon:yes stop_codon:yes gene_type:complete
MASIKKFYKNKKILVTGATGFKGAWLCSWLIKLGAKVYGLGFNPNENKNLFYQLKLNKKIKFKIFDIRNYKELDKYVKKIKPSIIFHLAAQPLILKSYEDPYLTFTVNYLGSTNIMEVTRKYNFIKSVVLVTTDKVYESSNNTKGFKENDLLGGIDPYSASKSSTELMIRAYRESFFKNKIKCGISSVRAGNVIGGGDWSKNRLIPDSIRSSIRNKTIVLRNPNFNRPWQFVLEPIKGYLILAKKQFKNPLKFSTAWNFGNKSKSVTTVSQIVEYIIDYWGSGKLKKLSKNKVYEQENLQLNSSKAMILLKWKPTYNVKQSVEVTTEWYYQVLKLKKKPSEVTDKQIEKYMHENKWY